MARIVRVDVVMVDLIPPVKRTDAIQSFISQGTPILSLNNLALKLTRSNGSNRRL